MDPYADSLEHLVDELKGVDLLVRRALIITRNPQSKPDNAFRGLVISEHDIDAMLEAGEFLSQYWRKQDTAQALLAPLDQRLQTLRQTIDQRLESTAKTGRRLTLPHLAQLYSLSPAEVDLLLIALAPELESRYETLYSYLQDDVTRPRPSVDLALNLTCRSEREKFRGRRFFGPDAPLIRYRMLELLEDAHDREPTLLRKFLKVEESLLRWLLENASVVLPLGSFVAPRTTIQALEIAEDTRSKLQNLVASLETAGTSRAIVRLVGNSQDELRATAEAISNALGKPLIELTTGELASGAQNLNSLIRNSTLLNAAVVLSAPEPATREPDSRALMPSPEQSIWHTLGQLPGPVFALGPSSVFPDLPSNARLWRFELPPADYTLRKRAWEDALAGIRTDADSARLADTFRFGGPQIRQATSLATSLAALRDPTHPAPVMNDVLDAGRSITAPNLQRYATAIQPRYTWNDIVLPEAKMQQLNHIAARFEHRRIVNRDWGFGEKLSRGKGLNILFTGRSGVGKTMSAEVLANALSLILYQIDISAVVSKFVGETEQRLSEIFREAELSQSLLFFDEADALFSKRAEVKEAIDRYSNLELNYLLQRIEQFEGIVILATNLQRNLDDAFLRRMHEVVDFSMPDETLRERIWRKHLPSDAPVANDIDFAFLARQFRFSGANIKNAVVSAAYLAASQSKKIGMAEMLRGVKMELEKQGMLVMKNDFGKHFATVQAAGQQRN
jgi:SpoVK/Ycf46/Vps4 family AAA+-type ATPase